MHQSTLWTCCPSSVQDSLRESMPNHLRRACRPSGLPLVRRPGTGAVHSLGVVGRKGEPRKLRGKTSHFGKPHLGQPRSACRRRDAPLRLSGLAQTPRWHPKTGSRVLARLGSCTSAHIHIRLQRPLGKYHGPRGVDELVGQRLNADLLFSPPRICLYVHQ